MKDRYDPAEHDRILLGDRFQDHYCLKCGHHGAAFATPTFFTACPRCLVDRIKTVSEQYRPDWMTYLHGAAVKEVALQKAKGKMRLSVEFDVFSKCEGCGKLVPKEEAGYIVRPGEESRTPHCSDRHERLKG